MLRQNVEALDQQRQMMDVLRASDFCVTSDTTRLHVAAKNGCPICYPCRTSSRYRHVVIAGICFEYTLFLWRRLS